MITQQTSFGDEDLLTHLKVLDLELDLFFIIFQRWRTVGVTLFEMDKLHVKLRSPINTQKPYIINFVLFNTVHM